MSVLAHSLFHCSPRSRLKTKTDSKAMEESAAPKEAVCEVATTGHLLVLLGCALGFLLVLETSRPAMYCDGTFSSSLFNWVAPEKIMTSIDVAPLVFKAILIYYLVVKLQQTCQVVRCCYPHIADGVLQLQLQDSCPVSPSEFIAVQDLNYSKNEIPHAHFS